MRTRVYPGLEFVGSFELKITLRGSYTRHKEGETHLTAKGDVIQGTR